ncbi:hypothetical protein BD289DRAFT_393570 [Coniella lustricola]|uniref:Uncharacterized protein n=1 Tax=Coniella lustricola TaxID=2025994 RepID=A0A2T3A1T7_9PEZI|nr:hypothetical protein BD289DRAFT_393570 [Coniella lustricola]
MDEALESILTKEGAWVFHSGGKSIEFNKDGSGELWCCEDAHFWIAMVFEWTHCEKIEPRGEQTAMKNVQKKGGPRTLGTLELVVTVKPQLPEKLDRQPGARAHVLNERGLTEDAFQPKRFTITVEQGNFVEPCYVGESSSFSSRYAFRLVFDKSPYPPRSEWKSPEGGPDSAQFWNITEFVGRQSDELKRGRAMNDVAAGGSWNYCQIM